MRFGETAATRQLLRGKARKSDFDKHQANKIANDGSCPRVCHLPGTALSGESI